MGRKRGIRDTSNFTFCCFIPPSIIPDHITSLSILGIDGKEAVAVARGLPMGGGAIPPGRFEMGGGAKEGGGPETVVIDLDGITGGGVVSIFESIFLALFDSSINDMYFSKKFDSPVPTI